MINNLGSRWERVMEIIGPIVVSVLGVGFFGAVIFVLIQLGLSMDCRI